MTEMVKGFKELSAEYLDIVGGKGGMLARMYQRGYPVPDGFVVLPAAFQGEEIKYDVRKEICYYLNTIRNKNRGAKFAVRSSALSEDSATASFAGNLKLFSMSNQMIRFWKRLILFFSQGNQRESRPIAHFMV